MTQKQVMYRRKYK